MINAIENNPYRILGILPTSSRKELVANAARIRANLRVNRHVAFPTDFDIFLCPVKRTIDTIADAESRLTLPKDVFRYAQFWFVSTTEIDKIAINNLAAGAYEKAVSIWEKKECPSSAHNLIVASLLKEDYGKAMQLAFYFYSKYAQEFFSRILGDNQSVVSSDSMGHDFLNVLCEELGAVKVSAYVKQEEWKMYLSDKIVVPLIETIERGITLAKETKGKDAQARLAAGNRLMAETMSAIETLKAEVSATDHRYQIIADKLGLEVLQCGIDYFNGSDEGDAAYKAMKLQRYAQSVVVGQMAKDRCDENVGILEKIIRDLPPAEVMPEHYAIQLCLGVFNTQPSLISSSIQLLKDCAPYVVAIKEKIGSAHRYYLKISTVIVDNALGDIIAEVNDVQGKDFKVVKAVLIEAWRAQLYMDKFDTEPEYKAGRFKTCRDALYGIIRDCKGFGRYPYGSKRVSVRVSAGSLGYGWCDGLDDGVIDLRTDDEHYQSCSDIASLKSYIKRLPSGKHLKEAQEKIEELSYRAAGTIADLEEFLRQYPKSRYALQARLKIVDLRFRGCRTIADFEQFIKNHPNSVLVQKAQEAIDKIVQEKAIAARQARELANCRTTNEVIALYGREKSKNINKDSCSDRAYQLAYGESDYRKVVSTFGAYSSGGRRAKARVDEIVYLREMKARRRKKIITGILVIAILLAILWIVYMIWGYVAAGMLELW